MASRRLALGIRSGQSFTGYSSIISTGSWRSMRVVSSGSTASSTPGFYERGFFRPIVREVVEKYLDCGNPRSGFVLMIRYRLMRTAKRCPHGGRGERGIFLIIRDHEERKSIVF